MEIPKEKLLEMYRNLLTARLLDGKLYELFRGGKSDMPWFHRRLGEEAIPIAVCANLSKDDYYKPTPFTVYCSFAKGLSLRDVIASECSRDPSKVGGHYSWWALDYGMLGFSGTLGEDVPIFLGTAVSTQIRKSGQVCVCIFGDGTANRGPIHEAMVMAAAWKLPIVFMIHNNKYGEGTATEDIYAIKDLSDRAKAYGFPGQTVDGNDVIATYEVVKEYVDRARSGGGPGLIVADTYRLRGHYEGDGQAYRPKGEVEKWWKKDPLPRYQKKLMEMGILTEADVSKLEKEIKADIEEAAKAALAMPKPTYDDYIKGAGAIVDVL